MIALVIGVVCGPFGLAGIVCFAVGRHAAGLTLLGLSWMLAALVVVLAWRANIGGRNE